MDWIKVKDRLPEVGVSEDGKIDSNTQESGSVIGLLSNGDWEVLRYFTYRDNDGTVGTDWSIPAICDVVSNFGGLSVVAWLPIPPTEGLLECE